MSLSQVLGTHRGRFSCDIIERIGQIFRLFLTTFQIFLCLQQTVGAIGAIFVPVYLAKRPNSKELLNDLKEQLHDTAKSWVSLVQSIFAITLKFLNPQAAFCHSCAKQALYYTGPNQNISMTHDSETCYKRLCDESVDTASYVSNKLTIICENLSDAALHRHITVRMIQVANMVYLLAEHIFHVAVGACLFIASSLTLGCYFNLNRAAIVEIGYAGRLINTVIEGIIRVIYPTLRLQPSKYSVPVRDPDLSTTASYLLSKGSESMSDDNNHRGRASPAVAEQKPRENPFNAQAQIHRNPFTG